VSAVLLRDDRTLPLARGLERRRVLGGVDGAPRRQLRHVEAVPILLGGVRRELDALARRRLAHRFRADAVVRQLDEHRDPKVLPRGLEDETEGGSLRPSGEVGTGDERDRIRVLAIHGAGRDRHLSAAHVDDAALRGDRLLATAARESVGPLARRF